MEGYFVKRVSNIVIGSSYYVGQSDGQKIEASLRKSVHVVVKFSQS